MLAAFSVRNPLVAFEPARQPNQSPYDAYRVGDGEAVGVPVTVELEVAVAEGSAGLGLLFSIDPLIHAQLIQM
jgi:hypothetical protein